MTLLDDAPKITAVLGKLTCEYCSQQLTPEKKTLSDGTSIEVLPRHFLPAQTGNFCPHSRRVVNHRSAS